MVRIEVRKATQRDISDLMSLDHLAFSDKSRAELIESSVASGSCLLALVGDQTAGYGVLNYSFFHSGFIEMLYVAEPMRRHGIGRILLREMEEHCVTPKLFTSTNESNGAMRSLLLSQGFEPSGRVENLDEGDAELIFFKRVVRPSDQRADGRRR